MIGVDALLSLVCRVKRGGVIVNYHTLMPGETRSHMAVLDRHFDLIHHDDLLIRLENPGRKPFCLITFDDGKRSNATSTAPILKEMGIPAVFYVVTQYLSSQVTPLWFDLYSAICSVGSLRSPGLELGAITLLPHAERLRRVKEECERLGVEADMSSDEVRAMSWDEARKLHEWGFTIGAHTLWHAILPFETQDTALDDIEKSISDVSLEIGAPCETFCFPNGNYTSRLARHAQKCGAKTVMTT